jgi:hypothetical protein
VSLWAGHFQLAAPGSHTEFGSKIVTYKHKRSVAEYCKISYIVDLKFVAFYIIKEKAVCDQLVEQHAIAA